MEAQTAKKDTFIKIPTAKMSRAEWLVERRKSLGGSDMGAVLGLNPWASPYTVWADKRGLLPDKEDTEAMRVGRDLEPYVAERFAEASGKKPRRMNFILRNNSAPCLHANIDYAIASEKSGLECKTASALNTRSFANGNFPANYYAQCITYLCVTEWERWYLAVLIMGREFKVFQMTTIQNDTTPEWCESSVYVPPEELQAVKDAAVRFWKLVEDNAPPAVDGTDSTSDSIAAIYAQSCGETVQLFGEAESNLDEFFRLKDTINAAEARMKEIQQEIQLEMQDAESAEAGQYRISWKTRTNRRIDKKKLKSAYPEIDMSAYETVSTSRPFSVRIMKNKEE